MLLARLIAANILIILYSLLLLSTCSTPIPPSPPQSPPQNQEAPIAIPPPAADFTVSTGEGMVPLTVIFNPRTTGEITAWQWNFGDGKFSDEKSPEHTYTSTGNYTVSLKVTGPGGSAQSEKTGCIKVASDAISWKDAGKYIGQQKTVEGVVVGTFYASTVKGQPTFLNFNMPYKGYFTCVIWGSDRIKFIRHYPLNPETYFLNKSVKVRGLIEEYPAGSGVPEIILKDPSQIEIISK